MLTMRGEPGARTRRFGKKVRAWNDGRCWRLAGALGGAGERAAGRAGASTRGSITGRYAAQGIDLEPQHKIGPAGTRREERGEEAERAAEHREIARRNGETHLAEPGSRWTR